MKYSVNYYSKRNRDFKDTYLQVPQVIETTSKKEKKKVTAENVAQERISHQFVVPWQMP